MKKILIAIVLIMCLHITGCTAIESCGVTVEAHERMPFERVYNSTNIGIYVDTETNVMYAAYYAGNGGGITVMVDQEGKPRLWEGE